MNTYGYVFNPNEGIDPYGLAGCARALAREMTRANKELAKAEGYMTSAWHKVRGAATHYIVAWDDSRALYGVVMKIFSIKQDVDAFKFYLQNENDPLSIKAYSYEGESLASGWTPFSINLFRGKTKLEKSLREDFNASCFDDGLLFVTEDVAEALCKVTDFFEQLQVITDDGRCFYYMNLTRKIPSLIFNDRSEIKDMYRSGVYTFNESIIANETVFRDDILTSNYFVTENFLKEFKYDIKGIYFKEVGEV